MKKHLNSLFELFVLYNPKPSHILWTLFYTFLAIIFAGPIGAGLMSMVLAGIVCRWSFDNGEMFIWALSLFTIIILGIGGAIMFIPMKIIDIINITLTSMLSYTFICLMYMPLRNLVEARSKEYEVKQNTAI